MPRKYEITCIVQTADEIAPMLTRLFADSAVVVRLPNFCWQITLQQNPQAKDAALRAAIHAAITLHIALWDTMTTMEQICGNADLSFLLDDIKDAIEGLEVNDPIPDETVEYVLEAVHATTTP